MQNFTVAVFKTSKRAEKKKIKFCIGQAQKIKLLIHNHELNIAKEQGKRLLEKTPEIRY